MKYLQSTGTLARPTNLGGATTALAGNVLLLAIPSPPSR